MYLSRVELGDRASAQEAFWREVSQPYGAHQALWRLLSCSSDQKRSFLFRAEDRTDRPSFLVLSNDRPEARGEGLWWIESKPFAPVLAGGQRLGFRLRASPVVRKGERVEGKKNRRVHRHDVVMDLAMDLKREGKALPDQATLTLQAGLRWLAAQGERSGFRLARASADAIGDDGILGPGEEAALRVSGYRQHRLVRKGEAPVRFSSLDFEGILEVVDPTLFLTRVGQGFGPQKAFGCGLMLLRKA